MNTYNDLAQSSWLRNATLQQLHAVAQALGIQNFPMNRNTTQTRAAIMAHLQANPQTALPTQNVPLPQPPPVPFAPATLPAPVTPTTVTPPAAATTPATATTSSKAMKVLPWVLLGLVFLAMLFFAFRNSAAPAPTQESAPTADPTESPVPTVPPTLVPKEVVPPTPTLPPTQPVPAAPTAGSPATSCTRRLMTVAEAKNLIDATSADEFADSLTVLFGRQVDTQCLQDSTSTVGDWQVNGPAVILTDPGHMPISGARVVKTWNFQTDWIFGVYFCPAGTTCTVPTPGRAVYLDGNLPETYLH